MDDPVSQATPTEGETYAEDRRARLHRGRLQGFALCIALWGLSVIPLARESMDGREGVELVAVYLAVGAISLGVAVVLRGIYVLLRNGRFWSPWVFLIAAVASLVGYAVQSAGRGGPIGFTTVQMALSALSLPGV